jgi:DNA polymerase-3 subunit epsilon
MLKLDRPLVFLDLETTGLNILADRIVEFSFMRVNVDGGKEHLNGRVNPGIPITPEAEATHHISDADVASCPKFSEYAPVIVKFFDGCDIAGFNNIRFDLPLLCEEFKRVKIAFTLEGRNVIDCMAIYRMKERRNLEAAYHFYCKKELPVAHTAAGDTSILADILEAQLNLYPDLPQDMKLLDTICHQIPDNYVDKQGKFVRLGGKIICNIGNKHKGHDLDYIKKNDPGFLNWIISEEFSPEVKELVKGYLPDNSPQKQKGLSI